MGTEKSSQHLHKIRHEMQWSHLALIIIVTVFLLLGGEYISIKANDKSFNQTLQNTAELISRQYEFTKELLQKIAQDKSNFGMDAKDAESILIKMAADTQLVYERADK